jgi:penicillin-binding protein 1A
MDLQKKTLFTPLHQKKSMLSLQQFIKLPQLSIATSANDQVIGYVYTEWRLNASYDEFPSHLIHAFTSAEDKRFFYHKGFDPLALLRACWKNLKHFSIVQGGSTITQQLSRIAIIRSNRKTLKRKLLELLVAIKIEKIATKDVILQAYLNAIYFGNNIFGVKLAACEYFGKHVSDLDLAESACLAGLIRAPNRYLCNEELLQKRKNKVLELMHQNGFITEKNFLHSKDYVCRPPSFRSKSGFISQPGPNIYYLDYVKKYLLQNHNDLFPLKQLIVKTAFEKKCQAAIDLAVNQGPSRITERKICCLIIDKNSGNVKAIRSGVDPESEHFNIAVNGYLQPGSTIKPFILAEALNQGFSLETKFESEKIFIDFPHGKKWEVKNFNDVYRGRISLSDALIYSDNTVFAQLILCLDMIKLESFLKAVGLDLGMLTPALATGATSRGTSPLQIAAAYTVFSNRGYYLTPTPIIGLRTITGEKVFESKVNPYHAIDCSIANEIDDLLKKVVTQGTGVFEKLTLSNLRAKTGTTNNDEWYVSYNDDHHLLTWVADSHHECKMTGQDYNSCPNGILKETKGDLEKRDKAPTAKQLAEKIWRYLTTKNNLADFFGIAEGIERFNSKQVTELEGYFTPWGKYG